MELALNSNVLKSFSQSLAKRSAINIESPSNIISIDEISCSEDEPSSRVASHSSEIYESECFSVGSTLVCTDRAHLASLIYSICYAKDKTIVRGMNCYKNGATVIYACYFSKRRKIDSFSFLRPAKLCPFFMRWELKHTDIGSAEYICTKTRPYHNHPPISDGYSLCINSADAACQEITPFYKYPPAPREHMYERQSIQHPPKGHANDLHSFENNESIVSSSPKEKMSANKFDKAIRHIPIEENSILVKDPLNQRIFISTANYLEIWNQLKDVLYIDTRSFTHYYFGCSILMLTVDALGSTKLIALGLTKFDDETDYVWIFNEFREMGFMDPQMVIIESKSLSAIEKCFKLSSVIFTHKSIVKNTDSYLFKEDIKREDFTKEFYNIYKAKAKKYFSEMWIDLIDKFPCLGENSKFMNLYNQRDKWAKFSITQIFTAGINSKSWMKRFEGIVARINKLAKTNHCVNIFTEFEKRSKSENKDILKLILEIDSLDTVKMILSAIGGIQNLYSNYCLFLIVNYLIDTEFCSIYSDYDSSIPEIEDRKYQPPKIFEANWEFATCSCKNNMRFNIPCSHLLYVCMLKRFPLNEFITKNTSKRWLISPQPNSANDRNI